jgi:hypothetical protein
MTLLVTRPRGAHLLRGFVKVGGSMNYVQQRNAVSILPHAMDWIRTTPADNPELRRSPRPVIAQWHGQIPPCLVILFEDGVIHSDGEMPIELLPHVQAEWLTFLRGKIA